MDMEPKNYYEVLEIAVNATPQEIERAYVRAKNAYSGDSVALYSLMTPQECQQVVDQIEEAYSVLGFPEKRREYDRVRGLNQTQAQIYQNFESTEDLAASIARPVMRPVIETVSNVDNKSAVLDTEVKPAFQYEDYSSNGQEARVSKIQAIRKFGLDYTVDQTMELKIEQTMEFTGATLREIREYKNVSMERLVEMTKISRTYLEAIENDNIKKLPADVYARGFVSQYAKVLKLNTDLVATSYIHNIKRLRGAP